MPNDVQGGEDLLITYQQERARKPTAGSFLEHLAIYARDQANMKIAEQALALPLLLLEELDADTHPVIFFPRELSPAWSPEAKKALQG